MGHPNWTSSRKVLTFFEEKWLLLLLLALLLRSLTSLTAMLSSISRGKKLEKYDEALRMRRKHKHTQQNITSYITCIK